ncbi:class I SAM-dependent methyltransferase [Inconstantimicrobium mannanitabidum]|uniref:SAM-dependent methyltransferase n=1 Tax=Inconstantimicrobium mannanitabidum TaxID=1604901 RepID=A0ACB5RDS4_9CLOT|nr:class I SAM-dependent methyltransferase [Clostridium sp. TW13]GKX67241.1 SAM-dependent methyltransferase [Clostridium sp. TW13]
MSSKQYFDNIATSWNGMRSEYFQDELSEKLIENINPESRILADLGCGTGFISLKLAQKNPDIVFAVDQSSNMLKELRKASTKLELNNLYPIRSTLTDLALFDESVDAITINMALHHVIEANKAIKEMYRVLKSSGKVIISDVYKHDGQWAKEEMFDEWLGFKEEQIEFWLEDAGFQDINIIDTGLKAKGHSSKGEYTETGIFIATAVKI